MELFTVKHYSEDERPTIKGNGFDGMEVGETREEAEEFVQWVNRLVHAAGRGPTDNSAHPIPWVVEQGVNGGVNIVDANGEIVVDTGTDGGMSGEAVSAILTAVNAPLTEQRDAEILALRRRVAALEEALIKAAERESRLIKGKLQNDYRPYPTVAT